MKLKKREKIAIGILAILVSIILFVIWLITPYFNTSIGIIDKPIENIDNTIEIELPDIEETEKENNVNTNQEDIYKEEKKQDEIVNILLCGMDARRYDTNSRSDTIILASYNKTQHTVKLVSFMRDTWVYLPEFGWSRINAATAYGGTGLLVNTLNHNFDLDIQNYVQIKFDDFKKVIDVLGGIDIELTKDEINYINKKLHNEDKDWKNDIKAKPGVVHLNGTQALWHCRNRTIGNSDFTRTERQREVLSILINKITFMNLGQATRLVFELRECVNTNLSMETILELGKDAIITGNIDIETQRIPYDDYFKYANKNGASVIEINTDKTIELLHEFLGYKEEDINESDK